jgi:MFS family permease
MYVSAPIPFGLMMRFPKQRRPFAVFGLLLMCSGLFAGSFANTVTQLIVTQGVMYAIGGGLVYTSAILYLDEWFIQKKGLAFGIMWAGTGLSGVVLPYLFEWGLDKYGFRTMLRAWSLTVLIMIGPLLYYVKGRVPNSMITAPRRFDMKFLYRPSFLSFQIGNIVQGLGYFLPTIYLPTYAQTLGIPKIWGTLTIVLFNTASVIGCVIMGSLIDHFHVVTCILISSMGAAASVFIFWGLAGSLPLLCIFALSYGLFAGSFTSTYTGIIKEVRKDIPTADSGMLFAFVAAGRGIGSILSGPLSQALLNGQPWLGKAELGYGSGYGALIVFTGVTAAFGGLSWFGKYSHWW